MKIRITRATDVRRSVEDSYIVQLLTAEQSGIQEVKL